MTRVSISKSYAVLLGLEGYLKTKKRAKDGVGKMELGLERVLRPEEASRRRAEEMDRSESARREREWLERQASERREQRSLREGLGRLGLKKTSSGAKPATPTGGK